MSALIPKPTRIQRKRTKGWKMPENTVYVGRPSRFGNPFMTGHLRVLLYTETGSITVTPRDAEHCVSLFRQHRAIPKSAFFKEKLAGKNLACWCALDQPCHADVLLEIANG